MKEYFTKVFGWLFIGLLTTFLGSFLVSSSPALLTLVFSGPIYLILVIAELAVAIYLGAKINTMKVSTAKILYFVYALLTGVTFSSIFIIFETSSIIFIFLATSLIFGLFALIGKFTKVDLSKISIYLAMILFGIIILQIINIFFMNNTLDIVLCSISLIIFMLFTAYDMQKIARVAESGYGNENLAIIGAFQLYLDFINIFIKLLRLFGKERD